MHKALILFSAALLMLASTPTLDAASLAGANLPHTATVGLQPLKVGDEMVFTYLPATGTTATINGTDKVTIPGQAFSQVLLSVWFGRKPPTASLKKGMLGEKS